jgi:hypothetical protein
MKVSELASALKELGTVFKHGRKDEPANCIGQLLKLIEGKEALDVSQLVQQAREANSKKRPRAGIGTPKKRQFDVAHYVTALRNASTSAEFFAIKQDFKAGKPTNDELRQVLQEYSGHSLKKANKDQLWEALESSYIAKQRADSRGKIASSELPI